jgi:hypothetical protein
MSLPSDRNIVDWVVPSNTSALCDAIPVLWQNTDLQVLSLLGATPTTSKYSKQSGSTPGETGTSSHTSTSIPHSSLSGGSKAAIGITIPLLFFALVAGVFLFFRRRNNRIQHEHHELPTSSPSIDGSNWTQLSEMQKHGLKNKASELDSNTMFEADGGNHTPAAELGDGRRSTVYEMEGSLVELGDSREVKEKNRGREHEITTPDNP